MPTPIETPLPVQGNGEEETHKPRPLQLDLPAAKADVQTVEHAGPQTARRAPRSRAHILALALGALIGPTALAVAIAVWVLPWYLLRQSVEVAAEHGIVLSVDGARVDPQGFRLVGVRATWAAIPGASARAPEIIVETSGLQPRKMTIHGADLTLRGAFGMIASDFANWRASPSGGQAGAWAPTSLVIDGARITWQAPIGDAVRVDATDVHAAVAWLERGPELHAGSDRVSVALQEGPLGPWRIDVDRVPGSSRIRVALDPDVPEACTILVVGDGERTTSVDVVIPRSPLAHLGVPEHFPGLGEKTLQVEMALHYVALGPTRADAKIRGGIYGVGAPGLPIPIDVAWEGTASGDPSAGIDLKKARLAVGPLVGPIGGTLKRYEDGFRLDLAWGAGPVPCAAFAKSLGLGVPFEIGYELQQLARSARLVDGTVSAAVRLSFDSRNLSATKLEFTPEIKCAASFFQ